MRHSGLPLVGIPVAGPAWGDRSSDRLGYDGAGRMVTKRYLDATVGTDGYSNTAAVVGFTAAYDHASNKRYERHLHAEGRSHLYPRHDSLDRLREYRRGTLLEAPDGSVSVGSAITLPGTDSRRSYELDGLGNWRRTSRTAAGGSAEATEVRRHNLLNQVTRFGTTEVAYDHGDNAADPEEDPAVARRGNGNIVDDGTRTYVYDAFNRLKEVRRKDTDELIATYTYDAFGRRVRKVVSNGGLTGDVPNGTTDYLYSGVQCVEERDGTDTPLRQYVWGGYVDELIQQKELTGGSPPTYYPLSDLLYRTVALTDGSKAIVETYDCDAYGRTLIYGTAGAGGDWWADDAATTNTPKCEFIFTGRRYDPETQLYFYRARYYLPELGRFTSRDKVGLGGSSLYEYSLSSPSRFADPTGQQAVMEAVRNAARPRPTPFRPPAPVPAPVSAPAASGVGAAAAGTGGVAVVGAVVGTLGVTGLKLSAEMMEVSLGGGYGQMATDSLTRLDRFPWPLSPQTSTGTRTVPQPQPQPKDKKPKTDTDEKCETCATKYPKHVLCDDIEGQGYTYLWNRVKDLIRDEWFRGQNYALQTDPAEEGPCSASSGKEPGSHVMVMIGKNKKMSIGTCPCCRDSSPPGEQAIETRASILNRS